MAADKDNLDERIGNLRTGFKSASRRAIEIDLAKAMRTDSWLDNKHKGHLDAVKKVYDTYCRLHKTR